jgi:hypothetical protein
VGISQINFFGRFLIEMGPQYLSLQAGIVLSVLEARCAYAAAGGFESEPVNSSTI